MNRTILEKANEYIEREMTKMYPELEGCKANLKISLTKKGYPYCRVTLEHEGGHKLEVKQRLTLQEISIEALKACKE